MAVLVSCHVLSRRVGTVQSGKGVVNHFARGHVNRVQCSAQESIRRKASGMNIAVRTLKNQMERPSFWQRTFNSGLHPKYREWGLNANPWKIGCCGLLGGFFGAMCGVGGGIVMIPLLYVE